MSAEDLMAEANKKVRSSGNFISSLFGSGSSKLDEAADLYTKAGNKFKFEHRWMEASKAFANAAQTHQKCGNNHDVCQSYIEASQAIRKVNIDESVQYMQKAIDLLTEMGRFSTAARQYQTLGDMYGDLCTANPEYPRKAVEYYEKAADIYATEDSHTSSQKCLLRVAELSAYFTKDYKRAIDIWEDVATKSLSSNLLKYGAKQHFFRAALCQLCIDHVNAESAIKRYADRSSDFKDSRECKFIVTIIQDVENRSIENFAQHIKEYDQLGRLDDVAVELLARVKESIEGATSDDLL